jgi:hypothetical protein
MIPCHAPYCPLSKNDDLPTVDKVISVIGQGTNIVSSGVSASTVAYGTMIKI